MQVLPLEHRGHGAATGVGGGHGIGPWIWSLTSMGTMLEFSVPSVLPSYFSLWLIRPVKVCISWSIIYQKVLNTLYSMPL